MKRIVCGLLSIIICLTANTVIASAKDGAQPRIGAIKYILAADKETSGFMPVRVEKEHVYADAEFLGALLGFTVAANNKIVLFQNLDKTKRIAFYLNSTKAVAMTYINSNLPYTSPCKAISEDSRVWVPLEFSLHILDSGMIIDDDELLILPSQETVLSAIYKAAKNNQRYNFDWQDDFGYSEAVRKGLGSIGYLTGLLNGLLHLDSTSAFQFVNQFFGNNVIYDVKYSESIAKLFVLNSNEEFEAVSAGIDSINAVLSPNGKTRKLLDSTKECLREDTTKFANQYLDLIKSKNPSSLQLNRAYKQFENALDTHTDYLKASKGISDIQDTFAKDTSHMFDVADKILDVIQYSSEFKNQDTFAIDALKKYCKNGMSADYIPSQAIHTFRNLLDGLEDSVLKYTFQNLMSHEFMDSLIDNTLTKSIKSQIGSKVSASLILWDILTQTVPFLKNGLDSADKFILASYGQIFQSDSYASLFNQFSETFEEACLFEIAQGYYTYLKFCYITRQSAVATLNHKAVEQKALEEFKTYQNGINEEIAQLLAVFKSAQGNKKGSIDNENRVYGFLPSDNELFLKNNSDEKLMALLSETKEQSFQKGNTMTNLLNGGLAVYDEQNQKHYYVLNETYLYCYDENTGKEFQVLKSDRSINNLNIYGGMLYYSDRTIIYKMNLNGYQAEAFKMPFEITTLFVAENMIYFTAYDKNNHCNLYSTDLSLKNTPKFLVEIPGGAFDVYNNSIVYLSDLNFSKSVFSISLYNSSTARSKVLFSDVACGNIKELIYEHTSIIFEIINGVLYVSPAGQRGKTIINTFDLNQQKKLAPIELQGNQVQANIFDGNVVCWDDSIGLFDLNSHQFRSLSQYGHPYLSQAFAAGNFIYCYSIGSCLRLRKDGSLTEELLDNEELLRCVLESQLSYEGGTDKILQFVYGDFNSDGLREAYAVAGKTDSWMNDYNETENEWFRDCRIYAITTDSVTYGALPLKEDLYGKIRNPIVIGDNKHTFFAFEKDGGGSGSLTYIFYFDTHGDLKESSISETYINFHEQDGKFIAYSHKSLKEGGHNDITHEFKFDENKNDFIVLH